MPPKSNKKAAESTPIPDIPWGADNSTLIWALLSELENHENYRVLFGKKDTSENTSGETKTSVYARIGTAILPHIYALNPKAVCGRIKSKIDSLTATYKKHAQRLRQTGEGVGRDDDGNGEETLSFYIMGDGPCVETPEHAVNIWKEIEDEFPFFPALHCIFASRPNVTPIVITTGLGPQGAKTVWHQPPPGIPASAHQRPAESLQPAQVPKVSRERSFGRDVTSTLNMNAPPATPAQSRGPKPSSAVQESIAKAQKMFKKLPQKRSIGDSLLEIQKENLAAQKAENKRRHNLELRKQIAEEVRLGLWTVEQGREQIQALSKDDVPPAKRQKVTHKPPHQSSPARQSSPPRQYSPDWDIASTSASDAILGSDD